jgi:polyhydroxybutyrate depolymerase
VLSLNKTLQGWLKVDGCTEQPTSTIISDNMGDGTSIIRTTYSSCLQNTQVVVYVIHGGGHAWPGGVQYLSRSVIGNTSENMDASQVIWLFFQANPKPLGA